MWIICAVWSALFLGSLLGMMMVPVLGGGGGSSVALEAPTNPPTHLHGVVRLGAAKGLPGRQQDIHQHTQRPPVNTVVVATSQHWYSNIVATDRPYGGEQGGLGRYAPLTCEYSKYVGREGHRQAGR